MTPRKNHRKREPTIALINIVFLMLIFFMLAGTLAPPLPQDLSLVRTQELDGRLPPDGLIIHSDGRLEASGTPVADAAEFVSALTEEDRASLRLIPDRDLPASDLLRIAAILRAAGAETMVVATEQALQ